MSYQPPPAPPTPRPGRIARLWTWIRASRRNQIITGVIIAVIVIAGIAGSGGEDDKKDSKAQTPNAGASAKPSPIETAPAAPAAADGPVAKPDAATSAAYIADLQAIDPAIVAGKTDRAISRGRDQCSSVKEWPDDQAKLVDLAEQRFTTTAGPIGVDKAEKVLAAVRKHICPQY